MTWIWLVSFSRQFPCVVIYKPISFSCGSNQLIKFARLFQTKCFRRSLPRGCCGESEQALAASAWALAACSGNVPRPVLEEEPPWLRLPPRSAISHEIQQECQAPDGASSRLYVWLKLIPAIHAILWWSIFSSGWLPTGTGSIDVLWLDSIIYIYIYRFIFFWSWIWT